MREGSQAHAHGVCHRMVRGGFGGRAHGQDGGILAYPGQSMVAVAAVLLVRSSGAIRTRVARAHDAPGRPRPAPAPRVLTSGRTASAHPRASKGCPQWRPAPCWQAAPPPGRSPQPLACQPVRTGTGGAERGARGALASAARPRDMRAAGVALDGLSGVATALGGLSGAALSLARHRERRVRDAGRHQVMGEEECRHGTRV